MIATVICIILLASYSAFVIANYVKEQKKAKEKGIPKGCYACSAFKCGQCPSHKNCKGKN